MTLSMPGIQRSGGEPRPTVGIARRVAIGGAFYIGTVVTLALLAGGAAQMLLGASERTISVFEQDAVPLLDLHGASLVTLTTLAANLGSDAPSEALTQLVEQNNARLAALEARPRAGDGSPQALLLAEAAAQWREAVAMIPGLLGSGVGPTDPTVLPFYIAIETASSKFREAHDLAMATVDERHHDLHALESFIGRSAVAAVLIVIVAVVWGVARELTTVLRPLRELRSAARRVARGEFDKPVPSGGPAELAELADAFNAMAEGVHQRESELTFRALHDPLTGLGNRALLDDRVRQAVARVKRHPGSRFALLFVDLDGFKKVNDTLGHAVGDETICVAAQRIKACLRDGDTLARMGGDEFAVLAEDVDDGALSLGERIRDLLRQPLPAGNREVTLTASIGIVEASTGQEVTSELLRHADLAMYRAKEQSGDQVCFFDTSLQTEAAARFDIEEELRRGIDNEELVVHYQPIVDLASGGLRGVEALVRWMHPTRGLLQPSDFLPIAEETGLIVPLGRQVLRSATVAVAGWIDQSAVDSDFRLSVNVAARQVVMPAFTDEVREQLDASGLDPHRLILEITETSVLDHSEELQQRLAALREMGIGIALDDFGIGYSSLQRLSKLPVSVVKIDRSFVSGVSHRDELAALVRSVLDLANSYNYEVIAEGIEELDDSIAIQRLGCSLGQGFAFHRPGTAVEVLNLLRLSRRKLPLA